MTFSKSFFAGLLFLAFGLGAVAMATAYPYGSPLSIGPGFFPTLAGILLAGMGGVMMVKAWLSDQPPLALGDWHIKPLLIINIAVIGFGVLIESVGLLVASIVLVVVSWFADEQHRLLEGLAMAVAYPAIVIALFVYGLQIPFKVWPF